VPEIALDACHSLTEHQLQSYQRTEKYGLSTLPHFLAQCIGVATFLIF
jgi:hypothetical protein